MTTLKITIDMDNSAFEDGGQEEVSRILQTAADKVHDGRQNVDAKLFDFNGNSVGRVLVSGAKRR